MKSWEYYSTPVKHPWIDSKGISEFISTNHLTEGTDKFVVANYIWHCDDETRSELSNLEYEFKKDSCEELGISHQEYEDLDPYDYVIGCPENHEYPSATQYKEMYLYLKKERGH